MREHNMPKHDGSPTRGELKAARRAERSGGARAEAPRSERGGDFQTRLERLQSMSKKDRRAWRRGVEEKLKARASGHAIVPVWSYEPGTVSESKIKEIEAVNRGHAELERSGKLTGHQLALLRKAEMHASKNYVSGGEDYDTRDKKGDALLVELLEAGIPPVVLATLPTTAHHEYKLLTYLGVAGSNMSDTRLTSPQEGLKLRDKELAEYRERVKASDQRQLEWAIKSKAENARIESIVRANLSPKDRAWLLENMDDIQDWFSHYGDGEFDAPPSVGKMERMAKRMGLPEETDLTEYINISNPGRRTRHRSVREMINYRRR